MKKVYRVGVVAVVLALLLVLCTGCGSVSVQDLEAAPYQGFKTPLIEVMKNMISSSGTLTWEVGLTGTEPPSESLLRSGEAGATLVLHEAGYEPSYMYFGYTTSQKSLRLIDAVEVENGNVYHIDGYLGEYENEIISTYHQMGE